MIVSDVVRHHAERNPARVALREGAEEVSFAALEDRVERRAAALRERGVEPGQRVAVLASNSAAHVEIVCAIARCGAVWVPLNARLAAPEIAGLLNDSSAVGLCVSPDLADSAHAHAGSVAWVEQLDALPPRAPGAPPGPVDPDAAFAIVYTSGTTGRPKGAVLTHRQFLAGAYYLALGTRMAAEDRLLQALPQFHAGGAIYQFAHLLVGASVVILPRFDPELLARRAAESGATVLGLVPAMIHALAQLDVAWERAAPTVRRVMYGGSSIDPAQLARMIERLPADYVQTYGQTEAGVIVTVLDGADHARAVHGGEEHLLRSCGKPLVGYDVRLADARTPGARPGEILVRSDSVMREYWRLPEATARTLVDGWLCTGDVGRRDADGYLYVVDRAREVIISGAENVYPREVEQVLLANAAVRDVAVLGIPDERWGQVVKAVVVPGDGARLSPDQLREFCRGRIAGFKIPRVIEFAEALPRNAAGKVLKHTLRS